MTSTKELKKQKKIIERNIKLDKERIKSPAKGSNTALKNCPNPSHWKEALKYDKKDLRNVNKKIALKTLKSAAKNAYKNSPVGKVEKAYKVTKAGLKNFLNKKKK